MKERRLPLVMKMDYQIRVQSVTDTAPSFDSAIDLAQDIHDRFRAFTVSIHNLPGKLAEIISDAMRHIGGMTFYVPSSQEHNTLYLLGFSQQFQQLSGILSSPSFHLQDLSQLLLDRLINRTQYPEEITLNGQRFEWGQRTYIMGILNITPDSFSGDGLAKSSSPNERIRFALEQAQKFTNEGASILDIGGESTRPGAESVETEEELRRVIPVVRVLAQETSLPISVDTQKAKVAEEAMKAGASIINDIWGLQGDPDMVKVVADYGATVVVMHNKTTPDYQDLISECLSFLETSIDKAERYGIQRSRIWIDPGIGFGKTREHNLEILKRLDEFRVLGQPLLLGTSRKSVIGMTLNLPVEERLEGTAATVALGVAKGADIMRVHDVRAMFRTARMSDAIMRQV
jgi:dihydropteroate synthase